MRRLVRAEMADIHTHLPAQVVSYDAATNTCKVRPCINRIRSEDPENNTVEGAILEDVPVKQFGSGKCLLTVAPQAGSYGWLEISERSLESWLMNGNVQTPTNGRKFDLSDAIFDPGLYTLKSDGNNGLISPAINTDRIELRTRACTTFIAVVDDETIEIETSGDVNITATGDTNINGTAIVLNSGSDWAVQYTALKSAFDTLKNDFNTFVTTIYNLHVHPGVMAGPASTAVTPTVGTSTTADMSSSKVSDVNLP